MQKEKLFLAQKKQSFYISENLYSKMMKNEIDKINTFNQKCIF